MCIPRCLMAQKNPNNFMHLTLTELNVNISPCRVLRCSRDKKAPMYVLPHRSVTRKRKEEVMNCVYAKTMYTGKSVVRNTYLVIDGQNVVRISKSKEGTLLGTFAVLTPAFIDPHSHIGMNRAGEPTAEAEACSSRCA